MRMDIAVAIEQGERVALIQHLDVVIGQGRGSHNVALIIPTIDAFHDSLSAGSNRPAQPAPKGGCEKKGRTNACDTDRFTKPFSDPPGHPDPSYGARHCAGAMEAHHPSDEVSGGQFLNDTPRDRRESSHAPTDDDHEQTNQP